MPRLWWEIAGSRAYRALGRCTRRALKEKNSEIALVCNYPMIKLAEVEGANYFGTEEVSGEDNYNTAHDMAKETLKLIDKEGVPAFLRDEAEEMRGILKEGGWE